MKKVLLLGAFAIIGLASCKKDYTCECTSEANGISATASTTIKDTKKKAKEACESKSVSTGSSTSSCKIKE